MPITPPEGSTAHDDDVTPVDGIPMPRLPLAEQVLVVADSQIGVREHGKNAGPEVEKYLASVHLGPGYAWCMAFVHWCFERATAGGTNPCPKTAGALRLLSLVPEKIVDDPRPGDVFVIDHGEGKGHVGLVESVADSGHLTTIEGNTNADGSREGDGVYRRGTRHVADCRAFVRLA